jgi:cysteine desulfurase/selenocysteine lyase
MPFSGHKAYGPTGTGVLYGREELLNEMPPWQGGGEMIDVVTFEKTTYAKLPFKFEAGTPHIAGIIGLGEAIRWMEDYDKAAMAAHEHTLLEHATTEAAHHRRPADHWHGEGEGGRDQLRH